MVRLNKATSTALKSVYKFTYRCSIRGCCKVYGTDKEENGRHLCPLHDLNFKDNKFKETFAEKLKAGDK